MSARYSTDYRVLGIHAVGKEETEVRREVIDVHTSSEVVLNDRETV